MLGLKYGDVYGRYFRLRIFAGSGTLLCATFVPRSRTSYLVLRRARRYTWRWIRVRSNQVGTTGYTLCQPLILLRKRKKTSLILPSMILPVPRPHAWTGSCTTVA